jgi:hypothetical protein
MRHASSRPDGQQSDAPVLCVSHEGSALDSGSPRSGPRPSSGQGAGDGCSGPRGAAERPASPAAGLLPIRPRPSRPAPDREWGLGRRGAVAQTSNPALNCRGDGDGTAAGSAAKATPTRATCGSVPCGRCSYRIVARDGCPLRPALLPYAQEVVTVQLLVSITRFVASGGESWGYGSRRG